MHRLTKFHCPQNLHVILPFSSVRFLAVWIQCIMRSIISIYVLSKIHSSLGNSASWISLRASLLQLIVTDTNQNGVSVLKGLHSNSLLIKLNFSWKCLIPHLCFSAASTTSIPQDSSWELCIWFCPIKCDFRITEKESIFCSALQKIYQWMHHVPKHNAIGL